MKIAVIGGGSTYTPELVNGFLERVSTLPVTELWLMDIDHERLEIVGGFARRMVQAKGEPFKVMLTGDQKAAIQGASYVITQLRVGQMKATRGRRIPWAAAWFDRAGDDRRGRNGESAAHHPGGVKNRRQYA